MRPEKESCLVEVLDRILNRGVVLNADLIISVAGVPLIGLNLRAALASMETMLNYGLMESWDKSTRDWHALHGNARPLEDGETLVLKAFGYLWQEQGILSCWLPGTWYLTDKRLFLWRPEKAVFEVPLQSICLLKIDDAPSLERSEMELVHSGGSARIRLPQLEAFRDKLEEALKSARALKA